MLGRVSGWKVWGELRRRTHLELRWAVLRGQRGRIDDLGDGRRRITIDATLGQIERRCVLAHELVHDERGVLFDDDTPAGVVRKEEAWVQAETTRRLVPAAELDQLVRCTVLDGGAVTWREVADWFDVSRGIAEGALREAQSRTRTRHPAERATGLRSPTIEEAPS